MTPVFPHLVRRTASGWGGELLLRLKEGRSFYVVQLPLEQARMLAVEMRGLATDNCQLHHLALRIAQALGAEVTHVVIKNSERPDEVQGLSRLVTAAGLKEVDVDAAAALALAVHLGLPIFMDGDFISASEHPPAPNVSRTAELPQIPKPFRELLEDLHMPDPEGGFPI